MLRLVGRVNAYIRSGWSIMSGNPHICSIFLKRISLFSCFLARSLLSAMLAFGQADQGTITAVVLDTSGGAVANAKVAPTNRHTDLRLQTATDSRGGYVLTPVKIGNYKVPATAPGLA